MGSYILQSVGKSFEQCPTSHTIYHHSPSKTVNIPVNCPWYGGAYLAVYSTARESHRCSGIIVLDAGFHGIYILTDVSMQYNCIFKYIIDDHCINSVKTSERMLLHSDGYGVLAVGKKRGKLLSLELPSTLSKNPCINLSGGVFVHRSSLWCKRNTVIRILKTWVDFSYITVMKAYWNKGKFEPGCAA